MMFIILLIALLTALTLPFRVRIFEAIAWSILTTPIWGYLIMQFTGVSAVIYWMILLANHLGWCLMRRNELPERADRVPEEMAALVALVVSFATVICLALQWNEFFPMGERLRDYALLSSVIRSPIALTDPWLHGYGLNYYAFWYRVGNFLSLVLHLPAPAIYNQLQTLTYGLFLGSIFRFTTRYLGWSWTGAAFAAVLIGFGSNLDGVFSVLQKSDNWWGPSRVIAGAINEFPAWSFLLGDLHPHFLNLTTIPLLLILFLHLIPAFTAPESIALYLFNCLIFLVGGSLLIYNANAWEVPVWGLIMGGIALAHCIRNWNAIADWNNLSESLRTAVASHYILIATTMTVLFSCSLWLSSRNILPNPFPATIVKPPIPQSGVFEFMRHWGVPMLATTGAALLLPFRIFLPLVLGLTAILTLVTGTIAALLWGLLLLLIPAFFLELRDRASSITPARSVLRVITIAGVILCLIPEYIFLDDPYGGENERMNTIFKMYSSNWFLFHLGALGLVREVTRKISPSSALKYTLMTITVLFGCAFFAHTVPLRKSPDRGENRLESLSSVADHFPGAAEAILFLRKQPGTIVLEGQGDAYNWTSFVSTLSDKDAYLGWANHVNLLVREYGEISRREKVTETFYTAPACETRREILEKEKIDYAIVGLLEDKKYRKATSLDYSCLKKLFEEQEYRIYSR